MCYVRDAGIEAVVDVGAYVGDYAGDLRAGGYRGRLLSIEPQDGVFGRLAGRCAGDPLWDCLQCGLGSADGEAVLSVSANEYSSSVLPILESHVAAAPASRQRRSQRIPMRTLDSVVGEWGVPDGLLGVKIDVQGYEAEVLRGATATLPRVAFLEIELSLVSLYVGQVLFVEMIEDLRSRGLFLVNVDREFTDPRTQRALQLNGIFLRCEDDASGGDTGRQRVKGG